MRLYRNLTEIMKAKKLGRKQAQKQVGSTIFELDRPIGELKCYICVDELYNRL